MSSEKERNSLFNITLKTLSDHGVLDHIVLIGGWCLALYREHFKSNLIPIFRTMDIDFMIPRPVQIHNTTSIPGILKPLNFEIKGNQAGFTKFVHPELELEFLVSDLGRGHHGPFAIPELQINAIPLRYLLLLQEHTMTLPHDGVIVRIPEPAAFVLHKYILSTIRGNVSTKAPKDLETAQELSRFLLSQDTQTKKLLQIFSTLPKRWKAKLLAIVDVHDKDLKKILEHVI